MAYIPEAAYLLDAIIHNRLPGHSIDAIRGLSPNISASTATGVIWALGGEYPYPTSAQTLEVLSSSASDSAAGAGARLIFIQGLDANWAKQIAVVATNGVTPVTASGTWLRVNHTTVLGAGSTGRNAGVVTTRVVGGNTLSVIPIVHGRGMGTSQDAVYTVPSGHMLYLSDAVVDSQDLIGSMTYNAEFRDNNLANAAWIAGALFSSNEGGTTSTMLKIVPPIIATGRVDLQVITIRSSSPVFSTFSFLSTGILVEPGYF